MEYRIKKAYRYLAFLLCTVLALSSPLTSAAAQALPGTAPSSVSEGDVHDKETNEKFIVKVSRGTVWKGIDTRPYSGGTAPKIQIDGKGVAEKKADGGWHVRLGYAGFSIYDAVQVVNPKKNADVFQYIADKRSQGEKLYGVTYFPKGTFNAPKSAESCIDPAGFSGPQGIESMINGGKIREEVNSYYLSGDQVGITCLDSAMDWGGIEFDVDSLSDYIIINPLSSVDTSINAVVVGFDEASLAPVPDSLTYEPGSYDMGYEWTNPSKGVTPRRGGYFAPSPSSGLRGDEEGAGGGSIDGKIESILYNIFEKDVKVIAAEDGTLSAVLKVNMNIYDNIYIDSADTPDPVSSIEWSQKRDTSLEGMETIGELNEVKGSIFSEILGNEWVAITGGETVTIPFKDLTEGKLIRITTKAQKTKNDTTEDFDRKGHHWGRLWLTKSVREDATEVIKTAENGAVLKTDTDTFKFGDRFVCTELSSFGDEATMENMFSTVKDEDSYRIYSYQILNGRGERKVPKSPITVDLPIPATVNRERLWFTIRPNIPEEVAHQASIIGMPKGSEIVQNEQGDWVLRITPPDLGKYDYQVCMFDTGERMTWKEMQALERGKYYELRGLIVHEGGDMPSMASPILRDKKVYLHVTEDGRFELYAKLKGIYVEQYGHLAKLYYFTNDGTVLPAETLAYKTAANVRDVEWENNRSQYPEWTDQRSEDDLTPDMIAKEVGCHYLDVIKIPLDEPAGSPYWKLSFVVPLMNMVLSGGDSSKYLKDEKQARLVLAAGSAKEVDPSEVYTYDKSLLLGTIEDVQKYYDTLQEGTEKEELKAAIDKAKAAYQELKTSFDKDKLLEAVKELKAVGEPEETPLLLAGTYHVPFAVNKLNSSNEDSGTVSPYMDYFDSAVVTVDDKKTMTVKLTVREVKGASITGLQYTAGRGGYREASPMVDDIGNVTGYTFTMPYGEKPFRVQLGLSSLPYPVRVFLNMDFRGASEVKALLKAALDDAKGYLSQTGRYTEESSIALQTAVNGGESIYSSYDGSEAAVAKAEAAVREMKSAAGQLKEKSEELTGSMKVLKELLDSLKQYDPAAYETTSGAAFQASREAALAVLDKNRGYEVTDAQVAAAVNALEKEREALIDPASLAGLLKERMLSFYNVPLEPKEEEDIPEKPVRERTEVPQNKGTDLSGKTAVQLMPENSRVNGAKTDDKKIISDKPVEDAAKASKEAAANASAEGTGKASTGESADASAKEAVRTPKEGAVNASAGGAAKTPAEGTVKTPAVGTAKTPAEGTAKTPAEGTAKTPAEGTVKSPAEGTAKTPAEGTAKTPAEGTPKTPAEGTAKTPADRTAKTPAEGTAKTPAEGTPKTPAEGTPKTPAQETAAPGEAANASSDRGMADGGKAEKVQARSVKDSAPAIESKSGTPVMTKSSVNHYFQIMSVASPSDAVKLTAPPVLAGVPDKAAAEAQPKEAPEVSSPNKGNLLDGDGVYAIDYNLWQFSSESPSMGNPALVDAYPELEGKQAKLEIRNDKAYLYLGFQKMEFSGMTGHLLEMVLMNDLELDGEGIIKKYKTAAPTVVEATDEKDNYGPPTGRKYPTLLKFDVTNYIAAYKDRIPVRVNVPVMGSSAEQPAYILLDYSGLQRVDGSEKPDLPRNTVDFTKLKEAETAASKTKGSFTRESYAALEKSLEAAVTLENYGNTYSISQDLVDKRTAALWAAANALIPAEGGSSAAKEPSGAGNPDTESADRRALGRILTRIAGYKQSDYTADSYNAVMAAYNDAYRVYDDLDAAPLEVKLAKSILENAIAGLRTVTVKKTRLTAAINTANTLQEANFTQESWTRLVFALSGARAVVGDENAAQEDVDSAWTDLSHAIGQLAGKAGAGSTSPSETVKADSSRRRKDKKDGYYKVSVRLWHANMDKASMGDSAVAKTAYVHIDGGDATMRMVSREMTVSGITAHLHDFWIYRDGDYQGADLVSSDQGKWVYEFDLPDHDSSYYKCKVDPKVDVMGDDPVKARLKVSWSSLKKVNKSDWDNIGGDEDDDNRSFTSSKPKQLELTSAETGIKVSGNAGGPGMALEASRMENGERYDRAANVLGDKVKKFVLYDISLRSGSNYVQPSGSVTVRIPVPNEYDSRKLMLCRIHDDGSIQEISGHVNGSYFEASVDHFSLYALGESSRAPEEAAAALNSGAVTSNGGAGISNSGAVTSSTKDPGGSHKSAMGTRTKGSLPASQKEVAGNTATGKNRGGGYITSGTVGQAVPYTGDPMPVKSLMGMGLLALIIAIGTMLPEKGSRKNRRKKGQAG